MKEEYQWLKRIIESSNNTLKHRPALLRLIDLYESKWSHKNLIKISVLNLRFILKQIV